MKLSFFDELTENLWSRRVEFHVDFLSTFAGNQPPWINNQQGTGESFRLCEPQVLKGEVCFLFGRMVTIETQSSLGWRSYQSTKFEFTVTLRNNTKQMSEKKESSWLPLNTMLWFHSRLFMKFSSLSCENNPAFCCADFWRLFCS